MHSEILDRYLEIKQMMAMLARELEELKPQVDELLGERDKLAYQGYQLVRAYRKSWQYSDRLQQAEAKLKAEKKAEETNGIATFTTTSYLTLRSPQAPTSELED